jgi:hypothetical protein
MRLYYSSFSTLPLSLSSFSLSMLVSHFREYLSLPLSHLLSLYKSTTSLPCVAAVHHLVVHAPSCCCIFTLTSYLWSLHYPGWTVTLFARPMYECYVSTTLPPSIDALLTSWVPCASLPSQALAVGRQCEYNTISFCMNGYSPPIGASKTDVTSPRSTRHLMLPYAYWLAQHPCLLSCQSLPSSHDIFPFFATRPLLHDPCHQSVHMQ